MWSRACAHNCDFPDLLCCVWREDSVELERMCYPIVRQWQMIGLQEEIKTTSISVLKNGRVTLKRRQEFESHGAPLPVYTSKLPCITFRMLLCDCVLRTDATLVVNGWYMLQSSCVPEIHAALCIRGSWHDSIKTSPFSCNSEVLFDGHVKVWFVNDLCMQSHICRWQSGSITSFSTAATCIRHSVGDRHARMQTCSGQLMPTCQWAEFYLYP